MALPKGCLVDSAIILNDGLDALVEDGVRIGVGWNRFVRGTEPTHLIFGHYLGLVYRENDCFTTSCCEFW